ncbi:putative secreted protein [Corynebacterium deserti GIMN1.010]|uniref:Putative secreted protein n=1 Tax=Corynebacterium deserti GIMN1.010 TaxID=931089 RepID=A0A0M5IFP4_9CORY|nr:hypothetical protein [Corynebacterium deserti]ALC04768.1 putative secreted protein [Corynebacterium deserti GIMN1.010]
MNSLPRYAPLISILALLVLVTIGGSALANNNSAPQVENQPATMSLDPTTPPASDQSASPTTATQESALPAPEPAPTQVPARQAPQPQPQAPPVPLNYQYYDDDWDDDSEDDWDDD